MLLGKTTIEIDKVIMIDKIKEVISTLCKCDVNTDYWQTAQDAINELDVLVVTPGLDKETKRMVNGALMVLHQLQDDTTDTKYSARVELAMKEAMMEDVIDCLNRA